MKSVLLIGLGRFGRQMAEKLRELRHQILAVDRDEGRVNDILELFTPRLTVYFKLRLARI